MSIEPVSYSSYPLIALNTIAVSSVNRHMHIDLDASIKKLRADILKLGLNLNLQETHMIAAEKIRRQRISKEEIMQIVMRRRMRRR